jgi:hypothetical protein
MVQVKIEPIVTQRLSTILEYRDRGTPFCTRHMAAKARRATTVSLGLAGSPIDRRYVWLIYGVR